MRNDLVKGTALVFGSASSFALLPIFIRFIYEAETDFTPVDVVIWRFIIALIVIGILLLGMGQQTALFKLSRRNTALLLGLGSIFGLGALMAAVSLELVPATVYTLIIYTYPAMVAGMNFLLGEHLTSNQWLAIGLALIGCSFTVGGKVEVKEPLYLTFPLLNAFFYALYLVLSGRYNRTSGLPSATLNIAGTLLTMLVLLPVYGLEIPQTTSGTFALIGLGAIATSLAILLMLLGMARIGASNAAILSTIEPVLVITFAAILLGERITLPQLIGGVFIILSVILLNVPLPPRLMFRRGDV